MTDACVRDIAVGLPYRASRACAIDTILAGRALAITSSNQKEPI